MPFSAWPGAKPGTFLIDDYEIVHVSTAQDLVPPETPAMSGKGALLVGGVDYGIAELPPSPAPSPLLVTVDRTSRDGRKWSSLPATVTEAPLLCERAGTLGLVRGFRVAGAQAVVASLGRVDDAGTAIGKRKFATPRYRAAFVAYGG